MAVLQDIKGLLSARREQPQAAEVKSAAQPGWQAEKARLQAEVRDLQQLVNTKQNAIERLEAEKRELETSLHTLKSAPGIAAAPRAPASGLGREVSDLEARKADLEAAVSQIDGLLQIKVKELAKRIARVYAEAGDIGANRDFRRITDHLEASENFGEFVRALLGE